MKSRAELTKDELPENKVLKRGVAALTDVELLATFLGSGVQGADVKQIARALLAKHGCHLLTATTDELRNTKGIGAVKAAKLAAIFELDGAEILSHIAHEYEVCLPLPGCFKLQAAA